MPAKQSKAQQDTVGRVMHEFKHGELKSSGGRKVKNPKQAIAIALDEAGASKHNSKAENKKHLVRTKRRERSGKAARSRAEPGAGKHNAGGETRAELYDRAKARNIPGRSTMSKAELKRALG